MTWMWPRYGKENAEFSITGRVLKYSRLSSKWVSQQRIARTEYNETFELLRLCYVTRSWIFRNVHVRVSWKTLVQLKI